MVSNESFRYDCPYRRGGDCLATHRPDCPQLEVDEKSNVRADLEAKANKACIDAQYTKGTSTWHQRGLDPAGNVVNTNPTHATPLAADMDRNRFYADKLFDHASADDENIQEE